MGDVQEMVNGLVLFPVKVSPGRSWERTWKGQWTAQETTCLLGPAQPLSASVVPTHLLIIISCASFLSEIAWFRQTMNSMDRLAFLGCYC